MDGLINSNNNSVAGIEAEAVKFLDDGDAALQQKARTTRAFSCPHAHMPPSGRRARVHSQAIQHADRQHFPTPN